MITELSAPLVKDDDGYAVALAIGRKEISILQGYRTEELLEEGYKIWTRFAEERQITKPLRVMFVDADDNPASYSKSRGRCIPTDSELEEKFGVN